MSVSTSLRAAAPTPRWLQRLVAIRDALPRGGGLSEESWTARHRGICLVLWAHVVVLPILGVVRGEKLWHALFVAAIVAGFAAGGMLRMLSRTARSLLVTLGLFTSSAFLVHFFDGMIEMHFHFFVAIAVVALYQSWRPYLVGLGFVVLHHAVVGTLSPDHVYNHGFATDNPALFALVHGGFILGESVTCLVYWKVTERALDGERSARLQLEKAHDDLARAQELSSVGSWDWNARTGTVTWSDQHYVLAGVHPSSFVPTVTSFLDLVHPEDHSRVAHLIETAFETRTGLDFECRLVRPDGHIRHVHALGAWSTDDDGTTQRMIGTSHDVTERNHLQAEIEHLAFHDPLTGLANRRLFMDRLTHLLEAAPASGPGCAVLFLTWTGSSRSTTPSATGPATRSSARWPAVSRPAPAR
jgi:PAS domain-containing protein